MSEEIVADSHDARNPSRDELFRLLTEEIKDITETKRLTGWTPWVILASLASGLWILAQDLLSVPHSKRACVAIFIIVTVSIDGIRIVYRVLDALSGDRTGRPLFVFLHSAASASNTLIMSLWAAGIAYCAFRLMSLTTNRRLFLSGIALYSLMSLMSFTMLIPIVTRLPFPMPKHGPRRFVSLVMSAIIVSAMATLVLGVIRSGFTQSVSIVEIRIGATLALGGIGIVFLSTITGEQSDSRAALSEIRRDLVLGGVSTTEASHRARTVLQGMWLSDVVMKDMQALLKLISIVRGEYHDAFAKVSTFKAEVISPSTSQSSDLVKLSLSNMLDTLEAHELRICAASKRYYSLLNSLRFRLQIVTRSHLINASGG